jgi:hypothetical protein
MPDTFVTLGDITFDFFEVPEEIPWGGAQRAAVHQLPGGIRIVDAMGADDGDLTWKGTFYGQTSVDRALQLDFLRKQGEAVLLAWGEFAYLVLITSFVPRYQKFYQIPYEITCKVVHDLAAPVDAAASASVDELADADMASVLADGETLGLNVPASLPGPFSTTTGQPPLTSTVTAPPAGEGIDLSGIASGLTSLRSAFGQVTSFTGATSATLLPLVGALSAVRSAVGVAVRSSETTLGGSQGAVGGVVAGGAPATMAGAFVGYAAVAQQAAFLQPMAARLARLDTNVTSGAI